VLVGLFIALAGLSLGLLAATNPSGRAVPAARRNAPAPPGKYKVITQGQYISPLVPPGFDCSKIRQLGIDRMENFRAGAIMIFCGAAKGGEPEDSDGSALSALVHRVMALVNFGGTDVDLITGTKSFPNITQSETYTAANPDDPNEIVVAFNDSRGRNVNPI